MRHRSLGRTVLISTVLALAGCGGGGGGGAAGPGVSAFVTVRGSVVGLAAGPAALEGGLAPLEGGAVVTLANDAGQSVSGAVTPADGRFSLSVASGHDYVLILREPGAAARTLGILVVDEESGRTAFSLPLGSSDVDLGAITIDPKRGKARSSTPLSLGNPFVTLDDADGDGVPNVADHSDDEDGDGTVDSRDAFPFDASESKDGDRDGLGDAADPDDDGDGVPDDEDAFPLDPGESLDTDGDGIGNRADPDDDGDGVADVRDRFPLDAAESRDTDADGIGNNADPDDDGDGIPDETDPSPLVPGMGAIVAPPPLLNPLNQSPVPEPPQLWWFVRNKAAAIELGKAFFWDMQTGSDGVVACATCHFRAGADGRLKNQLNPGLDAGDTVFGNNRSGGFDYPQFGPNYTLQPEDFPLHLRESPEFHTSPVVRDTNDVVGSQGVRLTQFVRVVPGSAVEEVIPLPDPIFNLAGANTRRVTSRHTPTVIDAVFNFANFWDGRANFLFNGENSFGPADPDAGVWFNDPVQGLVKRPVVIQFASLASQAVGPPVNDFEMSARGRTFPDIGRKLLSLTPLGKQIVHPDDSVLGGLSNATTQPDGTLAGKGLKTTYAHMIQEAFRAELWNSPERTPDGFTQMEANFSLFWGLAIQCYEATLVSDQTPFDRWVAGDHNALTEQQKLGFSLFGGIGNCVVCHGGIEFTTASVANIAFLDNATNLAIEAMSTADGTPMIYDNGFNNTAVTPTNDDVARGGTVPFVNPRTGQPFPLSFSSLAELQEDDLLPFETPLLPSFVPSNMLVNANGSFKVPGLRNVALTPPYFHNGSAGTLDQVLDFYARGGNFPEQNLHDLDPVMGALSLLQGRHPLHQALAAFLDALTDPRVLAESAPFDHPELFVPEGEPEVLLRIPARGDDGQLSP